MLFGIGKKVALFKKKDRETWQRIRDVLREEGVRGVRARSYLADTLLPAGCGCKLDPRDFGARGKVDRRIYAVDVREADANRARAILEGRGIEAIVEDDAVGELGRF